LLIGLGSMYFYGFKMHGKNLEFEIFNKPFNSIKYVAGENIGLRCTKNSCGNNSSKFG